jgi:hypothetical protein
LETELPVGDVPLSGLPGELLVAGGRALLAGLVPDSGFALLLDVEVPPVVPVAPLPPVADDCAFAARYIVHHSAVPAIAILTLTLVVIDLLLKEARVDSACNSGRLGRKQHAATERCANKSHSDGLDKLANLTPTAIAAIELRRQQN